MEFEQVQTLVDGLGRSDRALGQSVMQIGGPQHRLIEIGLESCSWQGGGPSGVELLNGIAYGSEGNTRRFSQVFQFLRRNSPSHNNIIIAAGAVVQNCFRSIGSMSTSDIVAREKQLRAAVLRGDEFAWQVWYDESFSDLLSYITWLCGGRRDQADEIVQETWLTAVSQIRKFDPERGTFSAWVRGLSYNLLRNYMRRANKAKQLLQPLAIDPVSEFDNAKQTEMERSERITQALIELPRRYEAVLKAKYLDGLSVNAIALEWNETPSAIESALTRARDAFRRSYASLV
jgi:RNA polymerase sigma-70 factor, ECF subfamily